MDANVSAVLEKKINRTIGNLQNNKMDAYYVKTCAEAVALVKELCPEGQSVSWGGSMTLAESGMQGAAALGGLPLPRPGGEGRGPRKDPAGGVLLRHLFLQQQRRHRSGGAL